MSELYSDRPGMRLTGESPQVAPPSSSESPAAVGRKFRLFVIFSSRFCLLISTCCSSRRRRKSSAFRPPLFLYSVATCELHGQTTIFPGKIGTDRVTYHSCDGRDGIPWYCEGVDAGLRESALECATNALKEMSHTAWLPVTPWIFTSSLCRIRLAEEYPKAYHTIFSLHNTVSWNKY